MNRDEVLKAIDRLKKTEDYLRECCEEKIKNVRFAELKPVIKDTYNENRHSLNLAITALQAQLNHGCEYCNIKRCRNCKRFEDCKNDNGVIPIYAFNDAFKCSAYISNKFCPMCGKRLQPPEDKQ